MHLSPLLAVPLILASATASAQALGELRFSVAVDVRSDSPEAMRALEALDVEARVVLRLVQERFAVVAPYADPDILLELGAQGDEVTLRASDVLGDNRAEVPVHSRTRAEVQLEVAQRAVDVVRARAGALTEGFRRAKELSVPGRNRDSRTQPVDATEGPQRGRLIPIRVAAPPPPPPPDLRVRIEVGGDALVRGSAVDPLARVGVVVGTSRVAGTVVAGFSPSSAPGIRVREWQVQAGPWARLWTVRSLSMDAAALAGVVAHAYWTEAFAAELPSGTQHDLLLSLPLQLGWQATEWLSVGVRFAPGIATSVQRNTPDVEFRGGRSHLYAGSTIWHREAARLEAGATLSGTF